MSLLPSGGYRANEALHGVQIARQELVDQKSQMEVMKMEIASAKNEIMILRVELTKCQRFAVENASLKAEVEKLKQAFMDTLDVLRSTGSKA